MFGSLSFLWERDNMSWPRDINLWERHINLWERDNTVCRGHKIIL